MKVREFIPRYLLEWLLVTAGVLGSLFCLITAFDLPVPDGLYLVVITASLFDCALFSGKKSTLIAAPLVLLGIVFFVYLIWDQLAESFFNLWGELAKRYAKGYYQAIQMVPREETDPALTGTALQSMAIIMLFPASLSVRRWRRTLPAALSLLPGILPCFVLTDTPPALLPLLVAAGTLLIQALSQSVRRRDAGEVCKSILLSTILAAGLIGLLLLVFPREGFKPPVTWKELSKKMAKLNEEQNNIGNELAGLSGNPEEVDLNALGALPNRGSTVLQVFSAKDAFLYLRGSSYCEFDGSVWRRGAEKPWPQEMLFPYLKRRDGNSLTVVTMTREDQLYTTYQLTELPAGCEVVSDAYVRNPDGRMYYSMRFIQDLEPCEENEDYSAWVRETCTEIPEQTRRGVLDWWNAVDGSLPPAWTEEMSIQGKVLGSDNDGITLVITADKAKYAEALEAYARTVAEAVSKTASYSRNPIQVPEGTDFCTWFLNDAEEGYCVHYATSCTALLRALGIPARYVSGYVCDAGAGHSTSISNLQAHAWVEAWIGGRWVNLEPTPGSATEFQESLSEGGNAGPADVESTEPVESETRDRPIDESDLNERATRPPRSSESRETEPKTGESSGGKSAGPKDLTPVWIFLGAVGFLALILERPRIAARMRERKLARARANDRARLLYRYIRRLHRLGGGAIPPDAERLAWKAAFSQYTLDANELYVLRQTYDQQVSRLSIAKRWKRFYCRYILAVI